MAISILLICIALQRLLLFDRYAYQLHWLQYYFQWLVNRVEHITQGHAAVGVAILLLPVVIVFSFAFTLAYHFFGVVFYALLNLLLVWVCIDARDLIKKPYPNASVAELFIFTYQRLFAVIFWFFVFGPSGLILYTTTVSLRGFLQAENEHDLLVYVLKLQGYLDWIPIRLLGLSFALMGHFAVAFKAWSKQAWQWPRSDQQLAVDFGVAALAIEPDEIEQYRIEAIHLMDRALLFWLIAIAIFTLEFWLG